VIKIAIRIVGSVSDESEMDQIQSIAKVFVYEQRMKYFTNPTQTFSSDKKKISRQKTDYSLSYNIEYPRPSIRRVRGFV
jgi:hypothetical protein